MMLLRVRGALLALLVGAAGQQQPEARRALPEPRAAATNSPSPTGNNTIITVYHLNPSNCKDHREVNCNWAGSETEPETGRLRNRGGEAGRGDAGVLR